MSQDIASNLILPQDSTFQKCDEIYAFKTKPPIRVTSHSSFPTFIYSKIISPMCQTFTHSRDIKQFCFVGTCQRAQLVSNISSYLVMHDCIHEFSSFALVIIQVLSCRKKETDTFINFILNVHGKSIPRLSTIHCDITCNLFDGSVATNPNMIMYFYQGDVTFWSSLKNLGNMYFLPFHTLFCLFSYF